MAKRTPQPKKQLSPEFKIGLLVAVTLLVLFGFDYIKTPEATTEKVSAVTGRVVAEVQEAVREPEPEPVQAQLAPAPAEVKIVSPESGSVQSGEFVVRVAVPPGSSLCYYQIRDAGSVVWDRRTRFCGAEVVVKAGFCTTKGNNTCYVLYTADSSEGFLGQDEAYYSIR